ncbi:MAG: hypothetical protein H8K03_02680 [Nitrospira sp.]|nr:hypothetical protein [Nitrospira sp. BO4]
MKPPKIIGLSQPLQISLLKSPRYSHSEGMIFIKKKDSPTHRPLLVVSHEVSNTITIFEIQKDGGDEDNDEEDEDNED